MIASAVPVVPAPVAAAPSAPPSEPQRPIARAESAVAAQPPAAPPPTFYIRTASRQYDFELAMQGPCAPRPRTWDPLCRGPAELTIVRKGAAAPVQRLALADIWLFPDEHGAPLVGSARADDHEGAVITGDFNFDGDEDLALQVGENGPYGAAEFDVYLYSRPRAAFVRAEGLSRLSRRTLGFFWVDAARHRLGTTAKDGCCYHVDEELAVVHDQPLVVRRHIVDATDGSTIVDTVEDLVAGKWQSRVVRTPVQPSP